MFYNPRNRIFGYKYSLDDLIQEDKYNPEFRFADSGTIDKGKEINDRQTYNTTLTYKGNFIDIYSINKLVDSLARKFSPLSLLKGFKYDTKQNGDNTTTFTYKPRQYRFNARGDEDATIKLTMNYGTGDFTINYETKDASKRLLHKDYHKMLCAVENAYKHDRGNYYVPELLYTSKASTTPVDKPAPESNPNPADETPKDNPAPEGNPNPSGGGNSLAALAKSLGLSEDIAATAKPAKLGDEQGVFIPIQMPPAPASG